ncbi:MAG TPA: glycosyltransferase family 4 protein [Anaerolineales bacterium]|nr:glycosyltransferase family 4 protein [Anaerolineales bacterium]
MMKICLIGPTYLPSRRANTIQIMKMAQALAECGYEIEVLAPDYKTREPITNSDPRDWNTISQLYGLERQFPITWLPIRPGWRTYDYGWKAVQYAKNHRADLVYTRLPQAAAISSVRGIPTVFEVHDFPQSHAAQNLLRIFLTGRGAQRLVVITHALKADLRSLFGRRLEEPFAIVAPDGVDLARYKSLPDPETAREVLGLENRFTAGYTGHLYPGRGIDFILELAQRLPHVNFLLVGGEDDAVQDWKALAAQRQLANVSLTGFIPNSRLPQYQAACEILLMPYRTQVAASSGGDIGRYLSPMKLFEYLACGRVILASDLPVLREVLNSDNAILLPPQDLDAWVEAIQNGLQFPEHYTMLARQAQDTAQQFTWKARVLKIFNDTL